MQLYTIVHKYTILDCTVIKEADNNNIARFLKYINNKSSQIVKFEKHNSTNNVFTSADVALLLKLFNLNPANPVVPYVCLCWM